MILFGAGTCVPLLAQLPIVPKLAELCDAGRVEEYQSPAYEALVENFSRGDSYVLSRKFANRPKYYYHSNKCNNTHMVQEYGYSHIIP